MKRDATANAQEKMPPSPTSCSLPTPTFRPYLCTVSAEALRGRIPSPRARDMSKLDSNLFAIDS
jgi:hypothetical protein